MNRPTRSGTWSVILAVAFSASAAPAWGTFPTCQEEGAGQIGGSGSGNPGTLETCPTHENPGTLETCPTDALRLVVMDPLCDRLACDCVGGYAQRKYDRLGAFLETRLARKIEIAYAEALSLPQARTQSGVDLIIGKVSVVAFDARKLGLKIRTVAMLTGQDGQATQTGLFVVRADDPAKSLEDLAGRQLLFGPEDSDEKHSAAFAALEAFDVPVPADVPIKAGCSTAALAVVEHEADAAVISSYAMPLLEGCGTIDKGTLRILARTDPVPFIGVFATDRVDAKLESELTKALSEVANDSDLLVALESGRGFFPLPDIRPSPSRPVTEWTDWRGSQRDAISDYVPRKLPEEKRLLWSRVLTGPGMSGMAVGCGRVVVSDKSLDGKQDVFRCLDADTGRQLWKLAYPAPKDMDFTNSPRANPVICGPLVYLLGAFGDLHCLKLDDGEIVWRKNLAKDFEAKVPMWGFCSTPLVMGEKLIVNPGAKDASVVALNRLTGEVIWAAPGIQPGYSSFIPAELGGVRQIVGYDAISLGGWDPETGKRLWQLIPELEGDFNVPTPIVVGDKLLVSTENNGTRLYAFHDGGRICPKPVAANGNLIPDTSTPVVVEGKVYGSSSGLLCLDLNDRLKTLWTVEDDPLADYCSFVAGNGRVLVATQWGTICLLDATKGEFARVGSLDLFGDVADTERDVWSHPSLVGNRIYVRNLLAVYCFLLE